MWSEKLLDPSYVPLHQHGSDEYNLYVFAFGYTVKILIRTSKPLESRHFRATHCQGVGALESLFASDPIISPSGHDTVWRGSAKSCEGVL